MKNQIITLLLFLIALNGHKAYSQINDVTTPLHNLKPNYVIPYKVPEINEVENALDKVYHFLENSTASTLINSSKKEVRNLKEVDANTTFAPSSFRLTSYEWGVTYAGMLHATEATGQQYFQDYTKSRLKLISDLAISLKDKNVEKKTAVHSVLKPDALDDAGALCAAMIKAERAGLNLELEPLILNFIEYISEKQFRFPDGTLARNRPQKNTLWLDDLFMSVPALAQMGKFTGEDKYFDDAVNQVKQFSKRMFNKEKGIYMHGWVESMNIKPEFHWARANGWAVMAMIELLEVLPENHPGREDVLEQLRLHIQGLASYQDATGFWHQLIDRNDSYLETSATAIYTYAIAKAINNGYVNEMTYGPMVLLAWNAVETKIDKDGTVDGTCVGTGMGFDPAFYYHRPTHKYAAHGYGPVLLAGAEIIKLLKNENFQIDDSAIQLSKAN
ncbi:glycoside hydrolase family 88/105 protein [Zunongwangia atlantica]|uniref:Glycoside hydrolase family protein n=1 Tax=Zunongwangia atlantica 22II14-10F7 TaxID=1185767 RepID=A0A1Y1T6D6_9FLAO|nr:glycoside hydrolase family 88 protein [Zunongwangia atlantica]ORL46154.1 glycoside hydrolase family protein [Zunongwangia atlantica 22II14-10F7]|tara:strand:- start:18395 stop:19729 length:1335 start_codon:yes stop_codon:yes gene_type:complete